MMSFSKHAFIGNQAKKKLSLQETNKPYQPTQVVKHKYAKAFGWIVLKELCKMTSKLRDKVSLLW
jgi:hypothetical protein